jgi:hypothetical protein
MAQSYWGILISSAIGALIGSALTLIATLISHRLQRSTQKEKDADQLRGLLQAIHDEIEALWEIYLSTAGTQIEALPDGHPLLIYWTVTQDYFTIYNTNAFFIGRIQDHDLRKAVVVAYARARAVIDGFRMNNELVHEYEYALSLFQETQNPVHQTRANAYLQRLARYAARLKRQHSELSEAVSEVLRRLRKEGVLAPKDEP